MATLKISTTARNTACDGIVDLCDAGGAGTLEIRTGSQPANPGTAASGTLLATFTLPNPAFGAASTGVATLNAVTSVTAAATGTAGYFRIKNNAGTAIMDGDCGTSGATLNLNTTSITSGGNVSITSGTITMPEG